MKIGSSSALLWTIQPLPVWEKLQRDGILFGPGLEHLDEDWQWRLAYEWMVQQMELRLGPRPRPGCFPLWAWYQWEDARHRRPDLRSSSHLPPGMLGVRLACEIPQDQLLLSDFMLWHSPLNYDHLGLTQAEDEAFEKELEQHGVVQEIGEPLSDPIFHQRILKSWERVFDLDMIGDPDWLGSQTRDEKRIQATLWQLSLDQVRAVTTFISRGSRKERK